MATLDIRKKQDLPWMTSRRAIALVEKRGIVLESARGPVPSLAETIADQPLRTSWWGHPKENAIFACYRAIQPSEDVLTCRLIGGFGLRSFGSRQVLRLSDSHRSQKFIWRRESTESQP